MVHSTVHFQQPLKKSEEGKEARLPRLASLKFLPFVQTGSKTIGCFIRLHDLIKPHSSESVSQNNGLGLAESTNTKGGNSTENTSLPRSKDDPAGGSIKKRTAE